MHCRIRRPSPAMVVACVALLVALGGTGYATVLQVPRNSVGTLQLKRNAVKPSKLAPDTVRSGHVLNGSLLAADFRAGQIPQGPRGEKGDTGAPGLSGYEIVRASTVVPANTISSAQAACPTGKRVIGGAASVQGVPSGVWLHTNVTLTQFYDAIAVNTTAFSQQVNAVAICARVAE